MESDRKYIQERLFVRERLPNSTSQNRALEMSEDQLRSSGNGRLIIGVEYF